LKVGLDQELAILFDEPNWGLTAVPSRLKVVKAKCFPRKLVVISTIAYLLNDVILHSMVAYWGRPGHGMKAPCDAPIELTALGGGYTLGVRLAGEQLLVGSGLRLLT
jgi:hypothetical protein